ncbi:ABC transporter substrate-binding protein [Glutamicibacter mishrai]|uniref:ABC transporter substrate-binding protein n=1 Tax=Glutamicibacter mishrai TaxID=1775880 RepID=UPI000746AB13|nr:ABC transporter substrate-binding protein [Glutamicibacter mishrai]KUM31152.1 peptide ABC transporter [Arthrobacter sp. EpRS66]UTT39422.1 ABC transporter substrate-binding protein [Glutamicibacter mishrai]
MNLGRLSAAASFAAIALALTACSSSTSTAPQAAADPEARVVVANFRAPISNWALESDDAYVLSIAGCLETLTKYDQTEKKVEPMLATSWKQTSDTVWEFELRKDVKFQDGTAFDAKAVAGSLNHVLEATAPARAVNPKTIKKVQALDADTVRVTTPAADPLLPYRMASVNAGVLSPAAYTETGIDPMNHCTGPFAPVSEKAGQSLTLDRNENYWDGEVKLAGGEIRYITDGATRSTQVQTGEADISMSIPATSLATLEADDKISVLKADSPRTSTLYLNNSRAPFDNVDLRKAATLALDLPAMAASVYEGAAQPATGPFAPSEPWANPDLAVPQVNIEEAKKLVEASGYKQDKPLEIIAITERAEFAGVGAIIQEQFKQIGLKANVVTKSYGAVEPDVLAGKYDMILSQRNRMIDIADPIGFLQADYSCEGGYNLSGYCNKDYDQLISQALVEKDEAKRHDLYRQAGDILAKDAVNVWLVNEQAIDGVGSQIQGYVQDPLTRYVLTKDLAKTK